ncbi:MAG: WecB/TagA/CpsF family glycosyltransferase [Planctomycetota bacterium]|nr:WecB/TagA/CpsF family glycosyltransferase [Planctomycetota bacterium]
MTDQDLASRPPLVVNQVSVANVTMPEAVEEVVTAASGGVARDFFFANADCMNVAARRPDYLAALRDPKARVYADGVGMRIAGWISRRPVIANVNGTDMFPALCERAAARGLRLYLLGAAPGVAQRAADRMTARFPALKVVGARDGFFDHERCDHVIDAVNDSGAELLLVAFGAPLQELFLRRHADRLQPPARLGVGGLFDFFSGDKPRAPRWLRAASLEWVWRLAVEPRRLWRRYLVGSPLFLARVLRWQLQGRNR